MLVLTRRTDECIQIGENIRVRILAVSGNKVRIAIEAPREIPVDRLEVWERRQAGAPGEAASPAAAEKNSGSLPTTPVAERPLAGDSVRNHARVAG